MVCIGRRLAPRSQAHWAKHSHERKAKAILRMGLRRTKPLRGYIYRPLTAQGPHAEGGEYDYLVGDQMIGGFALIAVPRRVRPHVA